MQALVQRPDADHIRQLLAQTFSNVYTSVFKKPNIGALDPVKECVMAICWELLGCSYSQPIVDSVGGFHDLIRLLAAAAVYQAGLEDVRFPSFLYRVAMAVWLPLLLPC
jgi:hypothetical protein